MSCHPHSGQNHNTRIANESFKNVATFKYLVTTLTNQKYIRDEIKGGLNFGNAWYHSETTWLHLYNSTNMKQEYCFKSSLLCFDAVKICMIF
jgi:hypothetical protein